MKKVIGWVRSHPARFYLAAFILMIVPAGLLYPQAQSGGTAGTLIFLMVIILANLAILIF